MAELLVVTTSLPRTPTDYAARFVLDWADALSGLGHSLRFVAPEGRFCPYPAVRFREGSVLRGDGAPEALRARPVRAGLSGLRTTLALDRALGSARKGELVAHWMLPAGLVACRHGRPLIYAHGGDIALLEQLPAGRRLARYLDRRARTLAFVSAGLRRRFLRILGQPPRARLAVAPMGVPEPQPDPAVVAALRKRAAGRPIVATVGRLVPIKGYDQLPPALTGLDCLWVAAGDGPERARLQALARRSAVDLHLLGNVAPPSRDALLSAATAFVQPSRPLNGRTEGAPVAVMEALVAGRPVVARPDGGFVEMLGPEPLLFTDRESLRARVVEALSGACRRQGGARYRWANQAPLHAELITSGRASG